MDPSETWLRTLSSIDPSSLLTASLQHYIGRAPQWLHVDEEIWNIAPLHRKSSRRIWNLDFTRIENHDLRSLARVYALWLIVERRVGPQSLTAGINAFCSIGNQLGIRPVSTLKTEDFYTVEKFLYEKYATGTFVRSCADLQRLAGWLTQFAGMRIDYASRHAASQTHGRWATDEQNERKLLPDTVVAELLASRLRKDISDRDKLFLCAIAISVATGFRLSELLTLPVDCLIRDAGALLVRNFVSKGGKAAPRAVPPELADIVVDAIEYIRAVTQDARLHAKKTTQSPPTDWVAIVRDEDSTPFEYFVRRWLANWIHAHENRLIDDRWAFFSQGRRSRWVPIADLLDKHNGNVSSIARATGLSRGSIDRLIAQLRASQQGIVYMGGKTQTSRRAFDTDIRFPSVDALKAHIGINLQRSPKNSLLVTLIERARSAQLGQTEFFAPDRDVELERRFQFKQDVIRDPGTDSAALELQDALFVLFKNQLSDSHQIDRNRIGPITDTQFNHWLAGYGRDRGTGKPGDAACMRLGIIDPRTNLPAKFTTHDFRHWLQTAYESGGLTQTQISTLFNRRSAVSNSPYDHTTSKIRHARLKDALIDGLVIGHAAQAYTRIASESPEEAAEYLEAATKFYNPMPHGICRLNWALEPCPHSLSCFSCGKSEGNEPTPCEHLMVDSEDTSQVQEIENIKSNSLSILRVLEEIGAQNSPQYTHFKNVTKSTMSILKTISAP